eukprot:364222-Chlamydomonas_euryale.AAC.11
MRIRKEAHPSLSKPAWSPGSIAHSDASATLGRLREVSGLWAGEGAAPRPWVTTPLSLRFAVCGPAVDSAARARESASRRTAAPGVPEAPGKKQKADEMNLGRGGAVRRGRAGGPRDAAEATALRSRIAITRARQRARDGNLPSARIDERAPLPDPLPSRQRAAASKERRVGSCVEGLVGWGGMQKHIFMPAIRIGPACNAAVQ